MGVPVVSVLVVTYKHERYIAQALDSALAQRVRFDYEIVVGDDCSPDRTGEIVRQYANRYPDRIRALPRAQNLGGRKNWLDLYQNCRGKYVAYLEGDDYWTSPDKLQRQVDLLESRPELAMCFHPSEVLFEEDGTRAVHGPETHKNTYTLADLARRNFIATASVLVRNGLLLPFPPLLWLSPVGDWVLHVVHATQGDIGFLEEVMAVYRVHPGGVYYARRKDPVADLSNHAQVRELVAEYLGAPRRADYDRERLAGEVLLARELLNRGEHARASATLERAWASRGLLPRRMLARAMLLRARAASPRFNRGYRKLRVAAAATRARLSRRVKAAGR